MSRTQIALLIDWPFLSVVTVALAGLRRLRRHSKPIAARRIRSYGVPLVACLVCCAYGAYLNTPRTLDRTLIAGFDELKQELQANGQAAGSLSVLSATSATLIAAPQLVYLLAELRRACIALFARSIAPVTGDTIDSDCPKCCELEAKV